MKKRNLIGCLCLSILLAGCGNDAVSTVQEDNNVNENGNNEETKEKEDIKETKVLDEEESEGRSEERLFSDTEEELEGMVQSVGEESVVISKILSGVSEEDGLYYAFSPGEGSEEEVLITVYVTEDTKYQYQTIKNGGEDVTEKEGKFTDIKQDIMIKVTGYMGETGEEMKAKEIMVIDVI